MEEYNQDNSSKSKIVNEEGEIRLVPLEIGFHSWESKIISKKTDSVTGYSLVMHFENMERFQNMIEQVLIGDI